MFRKIISLFKKDDTDKDSELEYIYFEDEYISQLNSEMDNNNKSGDKNGNLE